jgi:hypothetical protein
VNSDDGYVTVGGPDEATYVTECGAAWHRTPGAVAWLTKLATRPEMEPIDGEKVGLRFMTGFPTESVFPITSLPIPRASWAPTIWPACRSEIGG